MNHAHRRKLARRARNAARGVRENTWPAGWLQRGILEAVDAGCRSATEIANYLGAEDETSLRARLREFARDGMVVRHEFPRAPTRSDPSRCRVVYEPAAA